VRIILHLSMGTKRISAFGITDILLTEDGVRKLII